MLCTFRSKLELADILPMKGYTNAHKFLGLAVGYPVTLDVAHNSKGTVGLYVYVGMPSWQGFDIEGGIRRGAGFEFSIKFGNRDCNGKAYFSYSVHSSWGIFDFLQKSWTEVVCPNSPYFPGGMLEVELTRKPITN